MKSIFNGERTDCPMDNYIKTHGTIAGYAGHFESAWEKTFDSFLLFVWSVLSQCAWYYLPYNFVFDLYLGWYKKCRFLNKPLSYTELINRLTDLMDNWNCPWGDGPYGYDEEFVFYAMGKPEPMISEYGLTEWTQFQFGITADNFNSFTDVESYYGLRRVPQPLSLKPDTLPSDLPVAPSAPPMAPSAPTVAPFAPTMVPPAPPMAPSAPTMAPSAPHMAPPVPPMAPFAPTMVPPTSDAS